MERVGARQGLHDARARALLPDRRMAEPLPSAQRGRPTVQRYYYETHDQLRRHLADFVMAYNFARRLKTLSGLTPYEYICKTWSKEPDHFTLDPTHQMPGLNT